MDMPREDSPIEPLALMTYERLAQAVTILQRARDERPVAQERLKVLAQELVCLLDEIELFNTIVYCGKAAACLLDFNVLRVLAGSIMWENGGNRTRKKTRISKDEFWHKPSPAAAAALNRSTANGKAEWKDRAGRSINAIRDEKGGEPERVANAKPSTERSSQ